MYMGEEAGMCSHALPCPSYFSCSRVLQMPTSSANPITQRVSQKMKKKDGPKAGDDPTEGDGRRWAKGAKFHYLSGRLLRWQDARDLGEMSTFYSRITLHFIRTFTWEHALDADGTGPPEEASEENLDDVLNVVGLSAEEISRRNVVYLDLRGVCMIFDHMYLPSVLTPRSQCRKSSAGSGTTGPSR